MPNFYQKLLRDTNSFSEEQLSNSPDTLKQAAIVTGGIRKKKRYRNVYRKNYRRNERREKINGCS